MRVKTQHADRKFPHRMKKPIAWNGRAVRGVIFDMDGVIADTREAHAEAWIEFARREQRPMDINDFMLKTFGRGNNQVLQYFYPDLEFDPEFFGEKGAEKEEIFLDIFRSGRVPPVPGLVPFVMSLHEAGVRLSVGSSAPRRNIDVVLEAFGLTQFFPIIVSMHDVVHAKPDPEIFSICISRMGLHPNECVVIEDSLHGLEAARAAGCRAVGILTMHRAEEVAGLCDVSVPDFHALMELPGWNVLRVQDSAGA